MVRVLGILREAQNSPNRENDDTLILGAVLAELSSLQFDTALLTPKAADAEDLSAWDLIVPMCESYPRLSRLREVEKAAPLQIINRPAAVLACYRTRMLEILSRVAGVGFPPTELRPVMAPENLAAPAFGAEEGFWIKRGDVHNTCDHDVVFASTPAHAEAVRRDFARREISHLLIQKHIDGDLIKFYGVGPGQWFTWFYHDPAVARKLAFDLEALAGASAAAAKALGLEIFGGDAIVSSAGVLHIIDVNSWPSFARVREEAGRQIARHLAARACMSKCARSK